MGWIRSQEVGVYRLTHFLMGGHGWAKLEFSQKSTVSQSKAGRQAYIRGKRFNCPPIPSVLIIIVIMNTQFSMQPLSR
jgi:hypothetical protein